MSPSTQLRKENVSTKYCLKSILLLDLGIMDANYYSVACLSFCDFAFRNTLSD